MNVFQDKLQVLRADKRAEKGMVYVEFTCKQSQSESLSLMGHTRMSYDLSPHEINGYLTEASQAN